MKHVPYKCSDDHKTCPNPGVCSYCDGGLIFCTVCKCGEGSLPTDCPGTPVNQEKQELIYNGELDYKDGKWIKSDNKS
jgi:hypothetical protein